MSKYAVIGGTGLEKLPPVYETSKETIETHFGIASITRARKDTDEFIFLSRHGSDHNIAPHNINYRANIAALVTLGVTSIIATNAVGSLRPNLQPGAFVVPDDFIDFTRTRGTTYWANSQDLPAHEMHADFSEPYSQVLRQRIFDAANWLGVQLIKSGVYLGVEGPRFESPAEVRMFAMWGADVVGMTGLPEAVFAREAGLNYATIAVVTNYAAGLIRDRICHDDVVDKMAELTDTLRQLILTAITY